MTKEYNIEVNTERQERQFFINAVGDVIRFKGDLSEEYISLHYEIAHQEYPQLKYPEDFVTKKLGWITVGSTVYHTPIIEKKPTQAQINTLYDLGLLEHLCINDGKYYLNYLENENQFK